MSNVDEISKERALELFGGGEIRGFEVGTLKESLLKIDEMPEETFEEIAKKYAMSI